MPEKTITDQPGSIPALRLAARRTAMMAPVLDPETARYVNLAAIVASIADDTAGTDMAA